MSTHRFAKVLVPAMVPMPRGAQWASKLAAGLSRLGHRVWRGLEGIGQARAERELRGLAERHADKPEFAQALRDAMHRAAMQRDGHH